MIDPWGDFLTLDLMPLAAAVLAALSCGLIGNFLVLRRMAMMGDAISHAALPGLVIAFLISGQNTTFPMLFGAAVSGVVCALLVELIRKLAKLDAGASMGVVFTILFALGVVLVSAKVRHTHVDADCVLYGALEHLSLAWEPPESLGAILTFAGISDIPRQVTSLVITLVITLLFITILYKELRITCFDPQLATALGLNATVMHLLLMTLVALSVVASFEAVGVILVVAMLVCPAATARMLTDRLRTQIILSGVISVILGLGGYFVATRGPTLLFGPEAPQLQVSGMMATLGGLFVALAVVASPSHGLVAQRVRQLRHDVRVLAEDQLAMLFRLEESLHTDVRALERTHLIRGVSAGRLERAHARLALRRNHRWGLITRAIDAAPIELTEDGREAARSIVRSHRLWESYLVRELGLRPDHVHDTAMDLEHVTSRDMESQLARQTGDQPTDPHGKRIPE